MSHNHAPGDKPTLATLDEQAMHDYLARDLEALLDTHGTLLFLASLGKVLAERRFDLPRGADRRLTEAAVLLANSAA